MLLEDGVVKKIVVEEGKWGKLVTEDLEEYNCFKVTWLPEGYKSIAEMEKMQRYAYRKFLKYYFFLQFDRKQQIIRN